MEVWHLELSKNIGVLCYGDLRSVDVLLDQLTPFHILAIICHATQTLKEE